MMRLVQVVAPLALLGLCGAAPAPGPVKAMDLFQKVCVSTQARFDAVKAAAIAAGMTADPQNPRSFQSGSKARSLTIVTGTGRMNEAPLGKAAGEVCELYVTPASPLDVDAFHKWVGVARPSAAEPWSYRFVEAASGPRLIAKGDDKGERAAFDAGTLRMAKISKPAPELEIITYIVLKPDRGQ